MEAIFRGWPLNRPASVYRPSPSYIFVAHLSPVSILFVYINEQSIHLSFSLSPPYLQHHKFSLPSFIRRGRPGILLLRPGALPAMQGRLAPPGGVQEAPSRRQQVEFSQNRKEIYFDGTHILISSGCCVNGRRSILMICIHSSIQPYLAWKG